MTSSTHIPAHSFSRHKEIITINIGGAGVNLGQGLLEQYCIEQGISCDGTKESKTNDDNLNILFYETSSGKYYARSLFIDLDPYTINCTKNMYNYNSNYVLNIW